MTSATSPDFAAPSNSFATGDISEQQVMHYLMLRQANANQYDDNTFASSLASCRIFLERGVAFRPGSLHYSSTDGGTIGEVRPDMPTCILGCMLEHIWRPDRATALSDLFCAYHAGGHLDPEAIVSPPTNRGAPRAEIPALEAAALTKRFDQMFLLLKFGAPVVRNDGYDLLSTLDILNLPNRAEIGVRINYIVMERQIAVAIKNGYVESMTSPTPEPKPATQRRRVSI